MLSLPVGGQNEACADDGHPPSYAPSITSAIITSPTRQRAIPGAFICGAPSARRPTADSGHVQWVLFYAFCGACLLDLSPLDFSRRWAWLGARASVPAGGPRPPEARDPSLVPVHGMACHT